MLSPDVRTVSEVSEVSEAKTENPRNEFWPVISYEHIETFYKERNDQRSLKIISTCF